MCNACKELSKVWDASQRLIVSRFNNAKTGVPTFIMVQESEDGASSVTIEVNYCPWCGERLNGGKDDG